MFCFLLVLDEVHLTIQTHDLGTNPRDFQSGTTISEVEKPIPKIKIQGNKSPLTLTDYRIYSNKRRGAYLIFRATSAALIRGRRLFKHCTRQIFFSYIFIQHYTFYLLIFLWTDTKLIVNLELREKFTW